MRIAFVTDTGTGFAPDYWERKGIFCVPLQLECENISYDEYVNITYSGVIEKLYDKKIFRTSLPKLGLIEDCFEKIKNEGYDAVFCVPICKGLSGCYNAMEMIADQMNLKFYGVDCFVTARVQSSIVERAKYMYENGKTIDEIMEQVETIVDSAETILLFQDLKHMVRGGRLTPKAALLANLLKIVPICHICKDTEGRVDKLDKVRTMSKAQNRIIDYFIEKGVDSSFTFILAHVDCLEEAKIFASKIEERIENAKVELIELVSTVGVHTGLGSLGLQVYKNI